MGVSIHMLSALQRVLDKNKVFSPAFIMKFSDMGSIGNVKLALERTGLFSIKATISRASFQLSAITGHTTSIPWALMMAALGFMTI